MLISNSQSSTDGVAVTAVGAVTASGTSVAALFEDLLDARRPFTRRKIPLVLNTLPVPAGAEGPADRETEVFAAHIDDPLDLDAVADARAARTFSRDSRLLVFAAHAAGVGPAADPERTGVVLGTLRAGRNEYIAIHDVSHDATGPVNPVWGPQSGYNAPAAQLSINLGAAGPNLTLSSGATAGLDAIVVGARQLASGVCDTVVAAGMDTLSPAVDGDGGCPEGVRGPYDTAPGSVPEGEAAAVVVLRPTGSGHRELARVVGCGQGAAVPGDATTSRESAPALADAAEEAVRAALRQSGRSPAEVGLAVTASGGDRLAEDAERAALVAVFGPGLPVCNATGTTGRTGGADGTVAVTVAVEALARGLVPPVAGPRGSGTPARPTGPLGLCLAVEPGGHATAVLLDATDPIREGES